MATGVVALPDSIPLSVISGDFCGSLLACARRSRGVAPLFLFFAKLRDLPSRARREVADSEISAI